MEKLNSFIFPPDFPLRTVRGGAAPEKLQIPYGFQQPLEVLLAPHQDHAKQIWGCNHTITPPGSCSSSGPFSHGCSQENLLHQSFMEHSGHVDDLSETSRFGREVTRHSGLYEFHSCALCREVSNRELFAKITSLPLVFEIALFQCDFSNVHPA